MRQWVSVNICKEQFSVNMKIFSKYMNSGFTLLSVYIEVGIGSSLVFFQLTERKAVWYNSSGLLCIAGKPGKLIICISQIISLAY